MALPQRRGRQWGRLAAVAWWLLLALHPASGEHGASIATHPDDVQSLIKFKSEAFGIDDPALASWQPGTDPCSQHWLGIGCSCRGVAWAPGTSPQGCSAEATAAHVRVAAVDLAGLKPSRGGGIRSGAIAGLAALTELQLLNLSDTGAWYVSECIVPH